MSRLPLALLHIPSCDTKDKRWQVSGMWRVSPGYLVRTERWRLGILTKTVEVNVDHARHANWKYERLQTKITIIFYIVIMKYVLRLISLRTHQFWNWVFREQKLRGKHDLFALLQKQKKYVSKSGIKLVILCPKYKYNYKYLCTQPRGVGKR